MYTILVADDQELICSSITALLGELFPQLALLGSCNCGRDVMEILETEIPDILITDIRMPDINGLDVCRHVREKSRRTRIILISAYREFDYAKTALEIAADAYLVKPYAPRELVNALQNAIAALEKEDGAALPPAEPAADSSGDSYIADMSRAIMEYIESNYSNPELSLSMIAKHFNISYTYASYIFKTGSDASFNDFINQVRITRAKEIIRSCPSATLESIAENVGYSSSTYFGKIFKNRCGMTPSQYKRKLNSL